MLALRETQTQFASGILSGNTPDDLGIVADWLQPMQRLNIYHVHYQATLRDALALTFPVVMRLVGDGFFNSMADMFTAVHLPTQPCLAEYGEVFPDFIAEYEPARSLPYLSDVALFEWVLNIAAQQTPFEGVSFHSPYPIGQIWKTNQPDYTGDDIVDLDSGGGWFVIQKIDGVVGWQRLDVPEDALDKKETQQ